MTDPELPQMTPYQRLAIQMEAVVPLIRDLERVLGAAVVRDALDERVRLQIADAEGAAKAAMSPEVVGAGFASFAEGGALAYEVRESGPERAAVDVTSCAYARMMERLGARDLGPALVCGGDYAMAIRGGLELVRTQTCMEGASHCDFRYARHPRAGKAPEGTER